MAKKNKYKYEEGTYMAAAISNRPDNNNSDRDKDKDEQDYCVGGTRWGGSFLSPQVPPLPY